MKVIKSPNVYSSLPIHDKKIIFLAGSIEMGKAENWQEEIIEVLKESQLNIESTIVLNPRREDWDFSWNQSIKNSNFREQVEWELTGIFDANLVIFYFDANTQSPITLMELGYVTEKHEQVIVCCPNEYYRNRRIFIS
jgi:hypothetical protein